MTEETFLSVGDKAQSIIAFADSIVENGPLGEELLTQFSCMNEILGTLAQAGPVMVAFQETFSQLSPIIETVAHLAIPPPGGQVIAAALRLTAMIAKGAMNVRACRELSLRCNELLRMACSKNNLEAQESWNEGMCEQMQKFLNTCNSIKRYVDSTLKQGWVRKIVMWKGTADELQSLQDQINMNWRDLVDGAALGTFNIVATIDAEHKRVRGAIEQAGGPEKLCQNEGLLQHFINTNGYNIAGLNLQLTKQTLDVANEIKQMLKDQNAQKLSDGPSSLIANEQIKVFWRDTFRGHNVATSDAVPESVAWRNFIDALKNSSLMEDVESVLGGEKAEEFRLSLDKDDDLFISVMEVSMAFPKKVNISSQIELLRSTTLKAKGIFQAPAPPLVVVGRDAEIVDLINELEKSRVLVIRGVRLTIYRLF